MQRESEAEWRSCEQSQRGSKVPMRSARRDLAPPSGVSPAPATEQQEHRENNQYCFHFVTSSNKRKLDGPLQRPLQFFNTLDGRSGSRGSLFTMDLRTLGAFLARVARLEHYCASLIRNSRSPMKASAHSKYLELNPANQVDVRCRCQPLARQDNDLLSNHADEFIDPV